MLGMLLNPWNLLLIAVAGWMNHQQAGVIEYLREENRVLRELHGKKRLRLNDNQRRRSVRGKMLGRKLLAACCCIVTPEALR